MSIGSLMGTKRGLVALVGVAVALYLLAVWFLFLSPRRAEAARLQAEVVAAEAQLADARGGAGVPHAAKTHVSDLFRLAKAMPSSRDQASLLLELDLLARKANVTIASVSMQEPSALPGGSTAIPVAVTVSGTYRGITRFVRQMRTLAGLRRGDPYATGRLLTVQSVDLTESKADGFPRLDAALLLNAHVYDGSIATPAPVTPPAGSTSGSTGTTTSAAAATP